MPKFVSLLNYLLSSLEKKKRMNAFWEKKKNLLTDGARNSRPIRPAHISFSKTSLHSVQTGRGIRTVARRPRGARSWSWGPALRGGRLADTLTAGQSSCSLRGSEWRGSLLLGFHMAQKAFSRETQSSPSEYMFVTQVREELALLSAHLVCSPLSPLPSYSSRPV